MRRWGLEGVEPVERRLIEEDAAIVCGEMKNENA